MPPSAHATSVFGSNPPRGVVIAARLHSSIQMPDAVTSSLPLTPAVLIDLGPPVTVFA